MVRHDDRIVLSFAPEDAYLFDADGIAVDRGSGTQGDDSLAIQILSPLSRGEG
jgi:hypothetical protein